MPSGVYKNPIERSRKISKKLKGNKNALGFKHSKKTKKQLRENHNPKSNLNLIHGFKKGMTPWNKDLKIDREKYPKMGHFQKHSKKTKKKQSLIKMGKTAWNKNKKTGFISKNPEQTRKLLIEYEHTEKSKQKMRGVNSGEKHWNWQGGVTSLVQQIRHCFKYLQWRLDVFIKDDYTCLDCGARSGNGKAVYLIAHHDPKTFAKIFYENNIKTLKQALNCEEFWDINNGRTLCRKCHDMTKGGRNEHQCNSNF